jgi:hypothetical protein
MGARAEKPAQRSRCGTALPVGSSGRSRVTECVTAEGEIRHFPAHSTLRGAEPGATAEKKCPNSGSGSGGRLPIGEGAANRLARALLQPALDNW